MASRLFFDPMVALRAAPLVSSTCTLLYAWDQHFLLSLFNRTPETRKKSAPLLRSYFDAFFRRGVWSVLGFVTMSISTTAANLYKQPEALQSKGTFWWYVAGATLSAGHLAYVPLVAPHVKALMEAEGEDDVNGILDEWLRVNWWRMITVDLGAWVAFGVSVATTLGV
ncbi:integral membrane protein [Colletotrichum incanum]|uniref:Integral membrane protein n=1 Tax=Colletotrichum incanum TaxID=1573173 RepID=A0A167D164_COLIC|nr:integral membrane protein [Colletotrichum incanum]